jgi:hypothetical protein
MFLCGIFLTFARPSKRRVLEDLVEAVLMPLGTVQEITNGIADLPDICPQCASLLMQRKRGGLEQ